MLLWVGGLPSVEEERGVLGKRRGRGRTVYVHVGEFDIQLGCMISVHVAMFTLAITPNTTLVLYCSTLAVITVYPML